MEPTQSDHKQPKGSIANGDQEEEKAVEDKTFYKTNAATAGAAADNNPDSDSERKEQNNNKFVGNNQVDRSDHSWKYRYSPTSR